MVALQAVLQVRHHLGQRHGAAAQAAHVRLDDSEDVDVRILQARQQHAAGQIDHFGLGALQLTDFVITTDRRDQAIRDRDGLRHGAAAIRCVDVSIDQHQVCVPDCVDGRRSLVTVAATDQNQQVQKSQDFRELEHYRSSV